MYKVCNISTYLCNANRAGLEYLYGVKILSQLIIMSKTSIILQSGASLTGRALAQTAFVLDSNAVTQPE